ncbi:MAG: TraB/GumN family protein, partial [Sphingomonadales bacterium]|nr:TraB/GumN family protein [Sphingomonadales bacterium]MCG8505936.1 TraB/GumN family protein [Sphingomonadales bacterium]
NRRWVPRIEALLATPGVHFVAVGAGHLVGPDSVIKMLAARGIAAER